MQILWSVVHIHRLQRCISIPVYYRHICTCPTFLYFGHLLPARVGFDPVIQSSPTQVGVT